MSDRPVVAIADPGVPIALMGPQMDDMIGPPAPSVDGVAIFFVDPNTGQPSIVFVNSGLSELLRRGAEDLLGRSASVLYANDIAELEWTEVSAALLLGHVYSHPEQTPRYSKPESTPIPTPGEGADIVSSAIDLRAAVEERARFVEFVYTGRSQQEARLPVRPPETDVNDRYTSFVNLARSDGRLIGVHATYVVVPSPMPGAPYVVAQFRDLARQTTERLLADRAAVLGSLERGHELGRLCHQICAQVEKALGPGHRCALALTGGGQKLETVVSAGMPGEVIEEVFSSVSNSGTELIGRVLKPKALSSALAAHPSMRDVASLWFVPLVSMGATMRGAVLVASPKPGPDTAATRVLDHNVDLLTAAIDYTRAEAAVIHHALHDPLTHLPNRALLVDRLGQALARMERDGVVTSVLLVDIDRFRAVNDSRGVEVGDEVLKEVANRLLTAVRLGDTVGRISGDQFLVVCIANSGELDISGLAKRILRLLDEPVSLANGETIRVTASIGGVVTEEPGHSPSDIISQAEVALSQATAAGRGKFALYEPHQRHHRAVRHELEVALSQAVTKGELVVHYQPIVELRGRRMTGAEALIRWQRPNHGLVLPAVFVPLAEESDLVIDIGEWVIDRVAADLARWPKARGRSPMVSINLTARHIELDSLVPSVIGAIQRHGLAPERFGFEITESMKIGNLAAATVNLRRLAQLGCRIAIDDFGIGHATMDYLRRFSMAKVLKIERSFVAGLGTSKDDTAIVNASIALARSLDLQVIAEGVEHERQIELLKEAGCRYAQGYAFSRAVPFERALELWAEPSLVQTRDRTPEMIKV